MEKEPSPEQEMPDIRVELFRKYIVEEAFPRFEELYGPEEAQRLADRLLDLFKGADGQNDFERRVDFAIHMLTHPLAIQAESRRNEIAGILYRITSARLKETIERMQEFEEKGGPDNISPFHNK